MAAGGVFKLIANDGKADKMIMATSLLRQRIQDIKCARLDKGYSEEDATPTLVDIERTHVLFMNAHFKPFAAIGYEYNKVRSQSGTAAYGGSVQFSIPQFGDFFHDMVLHSTLSSVSAGTFTAPTQGATEPANQNGATHDAYLNDDDLVAGKEVNTYSLVDGAGATVADGAATNVLVRYCDFPGERLCQEVKFDVNGNPLDSYTVDTYAFHEKFKVNPNKRTGWNRLVGQEVPHQAWGRSSNDGTSYTRRCFCVVDGPQTPKPTQPALDLWTPLLFWFNKDVRLSIPSVSIPYGQRFITIQLAQQSQMVFTNTPSLWIRTTTSTYVASGTGVALDPAAPTVTTLSPVTHPGTITAQNFTTMELYINNVFVNPEIHDIYIQRIGFSLIRVHRIQTISVNTPQSDVLLSQIKYPVETLYAGLRPSSVTAPGSVDNISDPVNWHTFTYNVPRTNSSGPNGFDAASWFQKTPVASTVHLTAHGVVIFNEIPNTFFNSYMPYHYGGPNVTTPEDEGAWMINFCFYPGTYQPSGHINVSRAREFYLKYTSSIIPGTVSTADLIVQAEAINFLLISDGSAVLRYST